MDAKTYILSVQKLLEKVPCDQIEKACNALINLRQRNGTLFIFGNGGSASLASHLACDFNKGVSDPPLLRVNCLSDHISEMTAIANDIQYEDIFSAQLQKLMQPRDMIFAVSTSGNSSNIMKAAEFAWKSEVESIGLLGFNGGQVLQWITYPIIIPDTSVQKIEDIHVIVSHILYLKMLEPINRITDQ